MEDWFLTGDLVDSYIQYLEHFNKWEIVEKKPERIVGDRLFWEFMRLYENDMFMAAFADMGRQFNEMEHKYKFLERFNTPYNRSVMGSVLPKTKWADIVNDIGSSVCIQLNTFMNLVKIYDSHYTVSHGIVIARNRVAMRLVHGEVRLWIELVMKGERMSHRIGEARDIDIWVDDIWKPVCAISKYKVADLRDTLRRYGLSDEGKKPELYERLVNYLI
jgi:hypothetical protein